MEKSSRLLMKGDPESEVMKLTFNNNDPEYLVLEHGVTGDKIIITWHAINGARLDVESNPNREICVIPSGDSVVVIGYATQDHAYCYKKGKLTEVKSLSRIKIA